NTLLSGARASIRPRMPRGYTSFAVERFDGWADDLWETCRDSYGFIAVRDSRALNAVYPAGFGALTRLRVQHRGADVGWMCVRSFSAAGTWFEPHFGDLKLGILTDGLAPPAHAISVMQAGFSYLADE